MKTKKTILFFFLAFAIVLNNTAQTFNVVQTNDSLFDVTLVEASAKGALTWSIKPDTWTVAHEIILKSNNETLKLPAAHPIFSYKSANEKDNYVSPRKIFLQGAVNFRDLGGYITRDGKQVKWGKIYRSADISQLTNGDLKILNSLNLKVDCDLRGGKEVSGAPDKIPEGTERISLPVGSDNVDPAITPYFNYLKNESIVDSMILSFYGTINHFQKKYKPIFDQLLMLGNDQALLFHCTDGKDRTGIVAALILYALGVDETLIYKDFEASNEYRKEANIQLIASMVSQGLSEQAARKFMLIDGRYLTVTFEAIKQHFGTVQSFLEKEMGLTAEKTKLLQQKFLY